MACWGELGGLSRESLVHILEVALSAQTTPREIQQELLALSEYMGRHDYQLPISIRMQGDVATRCQAFAKALHYREMEYRAHSSISPRLVETLVSLHNALQQVRRKRCPSLCEALACDDAFHLMSHFDDVLHMPFPIAALAATVFLAG